MLCLKEVERRTRRFGFFRTEDISGGTYLQKSKLVSEMMQRGEVEYIDLSRQGEFGYTYRLTPRYWSEEAAESLAC